MTSITEDAILELIQQFFNSFDTKDWQRMQACLNDQVELDYEKFRGTPQSLSTATDYVQKRKIGLKGLRTKHFSFQHTFLKRKEKITCRCNFEIQRFEIGSDEFFHSYGSYEIDVKKVAGSLKIIKIKQDLDRSEGNRNIHGAFK